MSMYACLCIRICVYLNVYAFVYSVFDFRSA